MRKALSIILKIIGILVISIGIFSVASVAPVLYMLLAGQVQPDEPYFMGDLAGSISNNLILLFYSIGTIVFGFLIKWLSTWLVHGHTYNKALKAQPSAAGDAASGAP